MRTAFLYATLIAILSPVIINAQGRVGINTKTPLATLHVADSSVVFTSTYNIFTDKKPPAEGAGSRLMWYAEKAAFRVGYDRQSDWNADSVGIFSLSAGSGGRAIGQSSVSMGINCIATADASVAIGYIDTASGPGSVAMGSGALASGAFSTSIGYLTKSTGNFSTAFGSETKSTATASFTAGQATAAHGDQSASIGLSTIADGKASFSTGQSTYAGGDQSASFGFQTAAERSQSAAFGLGTVAIANQSFVVGLYNETLFDLANSTISPSDRIFQVGVGVSNNNRKTALTVLRSGNVGIGTFAPTSLLEVNGKSQTDQLQVNTGSTISNLQFGTHTAGGSASAVLVTTINFASSFTSPPKLIANVRHDPNWNVSDAFSITIKTITNKDATVIIRRLDANASWSQSLLVDYIAIQ